MDTVYIGEANRSEAMDDYLELSLFSPENHLRDEVITGGQWKTIASVTDSVRLCGHPAVLIRFTDGTEYRGLKSEVAHFSSADVRPVA